MLIGKTSLAKACSCNNLLYELARIFNSSSEKRSYRQELSFRSHIIKIVSSDFKSLFNNSIRILSVNCLYTFVSARYSFTLIPAVSNSRSQLSREGVSIIKSKSLDRKSTRLNSSHVAISYAVFCLKKKNQKR